DQSPAHSLGPRLPASNHLAAGRDHRVQLVCIVCVLFLVFEILASRSKGRCGRSRVAGDARAGWRRGGGGLGRICPRPDCSKPSTAREPSNLVHLSAPWRGTSIDAVRQSRFTSGLCIVHGSFVPVHVEPAGVLVVVGNGSQREICWLAFWIDERAW